VSDDLLKTLTPDDIPDSGRSPFDNETFADAKMIVDDVRRRGEGALREYAEKLGDIKPGERLVYDREELKKSLDNVQLSDQNLLVRTAQRIRRFAEAQRRSLDMFEMEIPGGVAAQVVSAVSTAGCYAPGGRFPLPSSVLMTAVTAKAAGVGEVWVASPKPAPITLAAASIANVDGLLAVGGAQAIAALAFGAGPVPACDAVVGPGNKFVTAAKQVVSSQVAIDLLAGPSELVIVADHGADAGLVAADLLAQAEHDPSALPILVTIDRSLVERVNRALKEQIIGLDDAGTAVCAFGNGFAVVVEDLNEAVNVCDRIAPEHLALHLANAQSFAPRFSHYGAMFVGANAAEVMGDYGAGPNHTLPTGGTARYTGGLSVFNFVRIRTWMRIDDTNAASPLVQDAARLSELEGLQAHAISAKRRKK